MHMRQKKLSSRRSVSRSRCTQSENIGHENENEGRKPKAKRKVVFKDVEKQEVIVKNTKHDI
jgi:hypothetical protein